MELSIKQREMFIMYQREKTERELPALPMKVTTPKGVKYGA